MLKEVIAPFCFVYARPYLRYTIYPAWVLGAYFFISFLYSPKEGHWISGIFVFLFVIITFLMFVNFFFYLVMTFGGVTMFLIGIGIIVYDIYYYLRHGYFYVYKLSVVLNQRWILDDRDWIGLKRVVAAVFDYVPVSVFFIVCGTMWMILNTVSNISNTDSNRVE
jgi:hypothetical protein